MSRRRKVLYFWGGSRRWQRGWKAAIAWITIAGISLIVYFCARHDAPAGAIPGCLVWLVFSCTAAYVVLKSPFTVFTDGMRLHTAEFGFNPNVFFRFSEVSETRLNTGTAAHKPDIEISTKDGKVISFPKGYVRDWDEFRKVLTVDLKDVVTVVE